MAGQFDGKVAIVTGGTLGIGYAAALELGKQGASVVIAGRRPDVGADSEAKLRAEGIEVTYIQADISQSSSVQNLVSRTVSIYEGLHFYVNSGAAVGAVANTVECTEENWHLLINTNLTGTFLGMKYAIPEILKSGGGSVVNVASIIGVIAFPGLPAYTASKAGIIGLTKVAALEYAKQGVRVNVVTPGSIRTPMFIEFSGGTPEAEAYMANTFHPMGRIGEPNEVANAIVWLCSDASSFTTGHVLPVAGGWEVP
ncbi:MAG: SDR family oxidoreductase [Anaerolineae bacterium]